MPVCPDFFPSGFWFGFAISPIASLVTALFVSEHFKRSSRTLSDQADALRKRRVAEVEKRLDVVREERNAAKLEVARLRGNIAELARISGVA